LGESDLFFIRLLTLRNYILYKFSNSLFIIPASSDFYKGSDCGGSSSDSCLIELGREVLIYLFLVSEC
jgi:hypothetical protein